MIGFYGNGTSMMGGGWGWGLGTIAWIALTADLILLGVWLWQQVTKK